VSASLTAIFCSFIDTQAKYARSTLTITCVVREVSHLLG